MSSGIPGIATGSRTPDLKGNQITIRGPINQGIVEQYEIRSTELNNRGAGYPVLLTHKADVTKTSTGTFGYQLPFQRALPPPLYQVVPANQSSLDYPVQIRPLEAEENKYRRARLTFTPAYRDYWNGARIQVGFYISVFIYDSERAYPVVYKFLMSTQQLNLASYWDYYLDSNGITHSVQSTVSLRSPGIVRLGFIGSSSNNSTQTQIIRNVSVTNPFSPSVLDKTFNLCGTNGNYALLNILEGDVGYSATDLDDEGQLIPGAGLPNFLDFRSFRFNILKDGKYQPTPNPWLLITEYGEYRYNPTTRKVAFVPRTTLSIPADTQEKIHYDIRNISGGTIVSGMLSTSRMAVVTVNPWCINKLI